MIDTYLAAGNIAYQAGYLTAAIGIPLVGLILLIVGLNQRSRGRRQPPGPYPPPYPPQYPPAPGYPPNVGYPGPPPPPGAYPGYPPAFPPPRTGSAGTALIVIGVVLLVLGGFGILGRLAAAGSKKSAGSDTSSSQFTTSAQVSTSSPVRTSSKGSPLQIGQCITETNFRTGSLDSGPSDCADVASDYELAAQGGRGAACPDGKSTGSIYDRLTNQSNTLCFLPNLKQGQCYMTTQGVTETVGPVDCTDSRAQLRVIQRTDGSTDTTQCPPVTKAIAFPSPPRMYCVQTMG